MKRKYIIILNLVILILFSSCQSHVELNKDDINYPTINPIPTGSEVQIELFFPSANKESLVKEVRNLNNQNEKLETIVINELFKGTKDNKLTNVIPNEVNMISIHTQNSIVYINLNKEFLQEKADEKDEALMIYSIINSLSSLESIYKVQILIEGKKIDKFNKYKLNEPIGFSKLIVDTPYISPISVIEEHYNAILKGNYRKIFEGEYSQMKNAINYNQFKLYYQTAFLGLEKFEITDYEITKYDRDIEIIYDINLIFADGTINSELDKRVYLSYDIDKGGFFIKSGLESEI